MAATFDRALMRNMSDVVGRELRALYNIGVITAPNQRDGRQVDQTGLTISLVPRCRLLKGWTAGGRSST